jgi:RimJ/RimL family protein N-acetyltransferase
MSPKTPQGVCGRDVRLGDFVVSATIDIPSTMTLLPFTPVWAPVIASWVRDDDELRRLAPSTPPPLTPEKVEAWRRDGGWPMLLFDQRLPEPIGYAELNPMRGDPRHYWLGHVLIEPSLRGGGLGRAFVRLVLRFAETELGARRISLIVFPDNPAALACYRAVGFQAIREERHRFGRSSPRHRLLRMEWRAD